VHKWIQQIVIQPEPFPASTAKLIRQLSVTWSSKNHPVKASNDSFSNEENNYDDTHKRTRTHTQTRETKGSNQAQEKEEERNRMCI
jgi:hypothetical protein